MALPPSICQRQRLSRPSEGLAEPTVHGLAGAAVQEFGDPFASPDTRGRGLFILMVFHTGWILLRSTTGATPAQARDRPRAASHRDKDPFLSPPLAPSERIPQRFGLVFEIFDRVFISE